MMPHRLEAVIGRRMEASERMGKLVKAIGGATLILGSAYLASVGAATLLWGPRTVPPPAADAGSAEAERRPDSFARVVETVRPAVVRIDTGRDGRRHKHGSTHSGGHTGSGLILEADGYVLTNDHLLGSSGRITVRTADQEEYDARVVGRDPLTDLAVLKVEPRHPLPVARLGDSDRLRVGDWVLAIGHPSGFEYSVTVGIVSGQHRVIGEGPDDDFIQTDALTNPGSSGGPLVNTRGEVVGIHNIAFGEHGDVTGIGLAIPVNLVKDIVLQLKARGRVSRGWLDIKTKAVMSHSRNGIPIPTNGAVVTEVSRKGSAAQAGIQVGDVIVAFQGKQISNGTELARFVAKTPAGSEVTLIVARASQTIGVKAELGELPLRWESGHGQLRAPEGA